MILSAIISTVAILVVACPCALGLATPTAVMVGMGKTTQNRVIFKGGQGLELLGKIQTIVFDKTRTLTEGKPEISDIIMIGKEFENSELLRLAAIAEKKSEHPLSKAIIKKAKEERIKTSDTDKFEAIPGGGEGLLLKIIQYWLEILLYLKKNKSILIMPDKKLQNYKNKEKQFQSLP